MLPIDFPFYKGQGIPRQQENAVQLPPPERDRINDPAQYEADPELAKAVNAALLLAQPLLLTGEPGTGKTQLANSVSWELGYGKRARIFETKSTSTARDLFYTFDAIGRFQAAQTKIGSQENKDYITYNALGEAILFSKDLSEVEEWIPAGFQHPGEAQSSVVLIDEIDKAPRDFPNDILNEVEHMYFKVPELKNKRFEASEDKRPVLILTSNSEKHLPDAFLRRCVYFHINFPDEERLKKIINRRIGLFEVNSPFLKDAVNFFTQLRDINGLDKKPATAELLGWLRYLSRHGVQSGDSFRQHKDKVKASLGVMVKSPTDQSAAHALVDTL
jgi:MoxR-like ATPase